MTIGNLAGSYGAYANYGTFGTGNAVTMNNGLTNPENSTVSNGSKPVGSTECETCNERKYQDGSNENVSFKSASHISPESAGTKVRAHEQEHVSNAYTKAARNGGKVLSANVAINTSICPECGRSFISGGLTTTKIQYNNESNPYQQNKKSQDAASLVGMNMNLAV